MSFNRHLELIGKHAFLSPSKYHWVNYDEEKLDATFLRSMAAQRGVELHEFAATAIRLKQRLPRSNRSINAFVNDAIGFRMTPEQPLYVSENAFGTADAISFRDNFLRIHDYKSGVTPCSMTQLELYAAFFCLEYRYKPFDIAIELRIYQNDEIEILAPEPDRIAHLMDRVITFDKRIKNLRMEAEL